MTDSDDKRPPDPAATTTETAASGDDRPPIPPRVDDGGRGAKGGRIFFAALFAVLVLAVAGGAVVMTQPGLRARALAWFDLVPAKSVVDAAARVDTLAAEIQRLDADVAALRNRPAPAPGADPARLDDLARRVAATEAALNALKNRPATEAAPRRDESALALLALVAAFDAGRPFDAVLAPARARLDAMNDMVRRGALDTVAARAKVGVPTAAMLAARARALRAVAVAPAAPPPPAAAAPAPDSAAAEGLWARIRARLGNLVVIRRVGDGAVPASKRAVTDDPTVALEAAATLFGAGEVAAARVKLGAIAADGLAPESRAALAALIADADARRAADVVATGAIAVPVPR